MTTKIPIRNDLLNYINTINPALAALCAGIENIIIRDKIIICASKDSLHILNDLEILVLFSRYFSEKNHQALSIVVIDSSLLIDQSLPISLVTID